MEVKIFNFLRLFFFMLFLLISCKQKKDSFEILDNEDSVRKKAESSDLEESFNIFKDSVKEKNNRILDKKKLTEKEKGCENLDEHFNIIKDSIKKYGIVDIKNINSYLTFDDHILFQQLLEMKLINNLPKGQIIYSEYYCKNTKILNQFQIFCFESIKEANSIFFILEREVNNSSYFEKPFKFFFLKDNKIYYVTSDTKMTCSSKLIEFISKSIFAYEVKYSYNFYGSGKKRF